MKKNNLKPKVDHLKSVLRCMNNFQRSTVEVCSLLERKSSRRKLISKFGWCVMLLQARNANREREIKKEAIFRPRFKEGIKTFGMGKKKETEKERIWDLNSSTQD